MNSYQLVVITICISLINCYEQYTFELKEVLMDENLIEGRVIKNVLVKKIPEFWPFYKLRFHSQKGLLSFLSHWATISKIKSDTCNTGIDKNTCLPNVDYCPNHPGELIYIYLNKGNQLGTDYFFTFGDLRPCIILERTYLFSFAKLSSYNFGFVFYSISTTANQ
jgi:hypothetical protein